MTRVAVIVLSIIAALNGLGQTLSSNPICYGQPIELNCNFLLSLPGCGLPGSTYNWENTSGSWSISGTREELSNVIINVGEKGYATDRFYLSVAYTSPAGSFSAGNTSITVLPQIKTSGTVSNILCGGTSTGSINLTVTGGESPYTYLWSNGSTNQDPSGLYAGVHNITVTDFRGCQNINYIKDTTCIPATVAISDTTKGSVVSFTITEPSEISVIPSIENPSSPSSEDGEITLGVSGGTAPYSYLWSNGQLTKDVDSLGVGDYTVTITDANSCTSVNSFELESDGYFAVNITKSNVRCNLNQSASIHLSPSPGMPNTYTYMWSDGNTQRVRYGLSAGTYYVTVTNQLLQSVTKEITITQ